MVGNKKMTNEEVANKTWTLVDLATAYAKGEVGLHQAMDASKKIEIFSPKPAADYYDRYYGDWDETEFENGNGNSWFEVSLLKDQGGMTFAQYEKFSNNVLRARGELRRQH